MSTTTDPDEYRERWNRHIDDLSRLKLADLDADERERVDELQDELREIVESAAENHENGE